METQSKRIYEFGPFRLDQAERQLFRGGQPVPLPPKVFDTLLLLVENKGHLVGKDDLIQRLWPDSIVEENSLNRNISLVRRALGETTGGPVYIETVPKRGYRFVAEIAEDYGEADLVVERYISAEIVTEEVQETTPVAIAGAEPRSLLAQPAVRAGFVSKLRHKALPISAVVISGLVIAVGYWWVTSRSDRAHVTSPLRSIAVLPFKNLGGDAGDDYLGLGIADALITRLSNLKDVVVRPTNAVRRYSVEGDAATAGLKLGVESVLDGNVQRQGKRIRLTVQLIRVRDQFQLWASTFDGEFTDIFGMQDSISSEVASALAIKLTGEERQQLTRRHTENTEAYLASLKGQYFLDKRSREGLNKGIEYFQQAIDIDPAYGPAFAGLAESYVLQFDYGFLQPAEVAPKAKAAAVRAIELDETLAEAHTSLALITYQFYWDWSGAEREFKQAEGLNPNYAATHHLYGYFLATQGRFEEGLAEMKRAQELDPLSPIINSNVGRILYWARRYDEAIDLLQKTLEMDPNFASARYKLAEAYEAKGLYPEAVAEYQKWSRLVGDGGLDVKLGRAYELDGFRGAMKKWLDHLAEGPQQPYTAAAIARIYTVLGDRDQAFAWLEKAYEQRSTWLYQLKVAPGFDSLRSDSRYQDLLRRMGLAS